MIDQRQGAGRSGCKQTIGLLYPNKTVPDRHVQNMVIAIFLISFTICTKFGVVGQHNGVWQISSQSVEEWCHQEIYT